jgi:ATP-dependent DNA helicase RecQ
VATECFEKVDGAEALRAIERLLNGEQIEVSFAEPTTARLASVLHSGDWSTLDLAVLVRQVLRFNSLPSAGGRPVQLVASSGSSWPDEELWARVGVDARSGGHGYTLTAKLWRPAWLSDPLGRGVDTDAAREESSRKDRSVPGDPFLRRFGWSSYQSPGQRAAVRAALTMPSGATLMVCLPTGEGKSFVFQTVAEFGFGVGNAGVSLVVTPTVALSLDQERAANELDLSAQVRAYVGGTENEVSNKEIAERIAAGEHLLCFASPEAVCRPLRGPLLKAARSGRLELLAIDEAHLVDSWGTTFRAEFQLLSGLRHELLEAAPELLRARTILLSATLTPVAVGTLRLLFGTATDGSTEQFSTVSAARLRPEIEYWVSEICDRSEQERRVIEALHNLPRPAIVYTTEVDRARGLFLKLRGVGFRRIDCMTGESSSAERREVVRRWSEGSVDVVVGTSAFGLGIDNAHVRTVIHVCVPESLDRFYQEVGRGGRDGHASISLLIPTVEDFKAANSLNHRRAITVERGFKRWLAMFNHPSKVYHGDWRFTVRLDVPPGNDEEYIDMVSDQSTDWNARTLTLMANSGLVVLEGTAAPEEAKSDDGWHEYQTLRVIEPGHRELQTWENLVEARRGELEAGSRKSLSQLNRFIRGKSCVAEVLAPLYEVDLPGRVASEGRTVLKVARTCGGCPACRGGEHRAPEEEPAEPVVPWRHVRELEEPARNLLDATNRLAVFYSTEDSRLTPSTRRRMVEGLATLVKCGVRNVIAPQGTEIDLEWLQNESAAPVFFSDSLMAPGLPTGATIVVVPRGLAVHPSHLEPRASGDERFLFLPLDMRDPQAPGTALWERYQGRQLTLEDFLLRLGI